MTQSQWEEFCVIIDAIIKRAMIAERMTKSDFFFRDLTKCDPQWQTVTSEWQNVTPPKTKCDPFQFQCYLSLDVRHLCWNEFTSSSKVGLCPFFFLSNPAFFFFSQLMGKRFKYWWIHFYFSVVIQHEAKTTYPKSWIQCRIFRIQQTFMSSIDTVQLYFWHTIWCFSFLQGVNVSKFCMLVWHEKEKPILTFFLRDKVIKDEIEDDN